MTSAEEEDEAVRWEWLLPRIPMRVMLVEGDDSTRQIIAALLRKCSYRVATLSDGLKAWESLKEKPNSIDLVLTEVELPSLSGFNLLAMIKDNESCNSIPVIMMSSYDSMSMIFKCMLRGAADFLVKPIRKNELRNLWQHVWRKQIASGSQGTIFGHKNAMQNNNRMNDNAGNDALLTDHLPLQQTNMERSGHSSDAQSSCTRSGIEAESERRNILEPKLPKLSKDTLKDHTIQNAGKQIQMDYSTVIPESKEKEATSTNIGSGTKSLQDDAVMGQSCSPRSHISNKVSDLFLINGQTPKPGPAEKSIFQNEILKTAEVVKDNDVKNTSNCLSTLDQSLRRYEGSSNDNHQSGDCNALNHSYSSAFSLYSNRTVRHITSRPINIENKSNEHSDNSDSYLRKQCSTSTPLYTSSISATSSGNTKNMDVELSAKDGSAVKCTPIRVISFPVPISGMPSGSGYATAIQPILYQQSAHTFWPSVAPTWQEQTIHPNPSYQSDQGHFKAVQCDHVEGQSNSNLQYNATENKDEPLQSMEESLHVSARIGVSASHRISSSGLNCDSGMTTAYRCTVNVLDGSVGNDHDNSILNREVSNQIDTRRLSQREVALKKFRLKRKERCFEKKVRYQSRKILAQQRPRVKGQFVRKEQLSSEIVPDGYYPSDSTPG